VQFKRWTLWMKLAMAGVCMGAVVQVQAADDAATPVTWPTAGWPTSTPEAQGVSSAALQRLIDFGAANDMDSLLVTRHGTLVVDTYYAPYRDGVKHTVNSTTKAVIGTLIGMAVQQGLLDGVNQPVLGFFPDEPIANVDDRKKAMTIEHLLDMTSGIDWKEPLGGKDETSVQMTRSPNWQSFVLDRPMAQAPGTGFNYNSGNFHLLSAVLSRKTGARAAVYAQQQLFAPLGITDVMWRRDAQGVSMGGFGLYLHPRDMAKIGYLYLHGGAWDGKQLLPPDWTNKVFHASVDMNWGSGRGFRYANGWWTIPSKDAYMAVGMDRQLIVVLPKLDIVAAMTGRKNYPFGPMLDLLAASATSNAALPADAPAQAALAQRVKAAAVEVATPVGPTSPRAQSLSMQTFEFKHNPLDVKTLRLDFNPIEPRYEMVIETGRTDVPTRLLTGPIGLDGSFRINEKITQPLVGVKGNWTDENTFVLTSRLISEGQQSTYTLRFGEETVDVAFRDDHDFAATFQGAMAR
jgi:CubicO group peptidase (beta-lactamase class C family)